MERSGHIVEILDLGDARIFEPYRVKREKTWEAIGVRSISARCIAATDVALPCAQRLASEAAGSKMEGGPRARHHSALRLLQRDRHAGANRIVYFGHGVGNAQELGDPVRCGGR